jgi:hypothetical protein
MNFRIVVVGRVATAATENGGISPYHHSKKPIADRLFAFL